MSRGVSKESPFTVTEITNAVKETLEQNIGKVWIKGEISNHSSPASGHIYFTLKDDTNQIKVAVFRGSMRSAGLEDGQKVTVFGRLSIYGKRSEYQLIGEEVHVIGVGELLVEFEKLKKKLQEKGLFEQSHKRKIPKFPNKIAVITSKTGAVIRDIINVTERRYRLAEILLYPVMVQGEEAPPQIIKAIKDVNQIEGVDLIILARGGGSPEDLWAFNDEKLAYAIYESDIPVISAVGHEVDFTIADFVADLRAPTPSAAAEMAVPDTGELLNMLSNTARRLVNSLSNKVSVHERRLEAIAKSYAFKIPFEMYKDHAIRVDEISAGITKAVENMARVKSETADILSGKLELLNPLGILKKGYSVAYDSFGNIIKDASALEAGAAVSVRLHKGGFDAKIERIKKDEKTE